mgnify:CR=1 FL=1|tara:strand:- start:2715 stop:5006 length:2292 start_codon:yes stop_codon:yes gene_type:complete
MATLPPTEPTKSCEVPLEKESEELPFNGLSISIQAGKSHITQNVYFLRFDATQSQPEHGKLFLTLGGNLNVAADDAATDFALTHSTHAEYAILDRNHPTRMQIQLPSKLVDVREGKLFMNSRTKLNIASQRIGAAINGTLVDTRSGAGSVYLSTFLKQGGVHYLQPLTYGASAAHTSIIGASNISIVDFDDNPVDVTFVTNQDQQAKLDAAENEVDQWAHAAWNLRTKHLVYQLSPALTKTVGKAPVGVNDKGYDLVHNIIDQEFPFGKHVLNQLLEKAAGMELEYDAQQIDKFLNATAKPGLKAAVWMQTVASSVSTVANYLVAYRSDGCVLQGATGAMFGAIESWLRAALRTPISSNDCDGTAMLSIGMLQAALDSTEEDRMQYPYIRAARNVLHPYYTVGIAVVGATSAEASAGGGTKETVAGHALALVMDTSSLLNGLHTAAAQHTVGGKPIADNPEEVRFARHDAIFSPEVLAELPIEERELLAKGPESLRGDSKVARTIAALQPHAIEGTTPASSVLYVADSEKRAVAIRDAEFDNKAFALAAPNVGRSFKVLHAGPNSKNPHQFYHDIVDFTLHAKHPLYTNATIRALGKGASQYVFVKPSATRPLSDAGASPVELAMREFVIVPLYEINTAVGNTLDFAGEVAKADVIPPRKGPYPLTRNQSRDLKRSISALEDLDNKLPKEPVPGHCVAYMLAYSTLVNNPTAVEHFCERIAQSSIAGVIDFLIIDGLAVHPDEEGKVAEQAGHFVIVNSVVNV